MTNADDDGPIDVEQWKQQFSDTITKEVFQLIAREGEIYGKDFSDGVALNVLASLVSTILFNALDQAKKAALPEVVVFHRFGQMKLSVQNAVASGFEGCMSVWRGKPCEYYCTVEVIPEPQNIHPV